MRNGQTWTAAARDALGDPAAKRVLNERLFTVIAPRYDFITRALSFGRDAAWKEALVAALPASGARVCVDLACGTGDVAAALAARYPAGRVTGIDLTASMLAIARARHRAGNLDFTLGDMTALAVPDGSVDVVTGSYALRNAPELESVLAEVRRVLRPGGVAAFLDFSKPAAPLGQRVVLGLLRFWGGLWGMLLHGDPGVYGYIAQSLARFPDRQQMVPRLHAQGLALRQMRRFCLGMIDLIVVQKGAATYKNGDVTLKRLDFSKRETCAERMDAPDCDAVLLKRTLQQFRGINRLVSRYRTLLTRHVLADMRRDPLREYHLVDLGAGSCDIAVWLLRRARALGLRLRVTALDADPRVAAWAREWTAGEAGLTVVCAGAAEFSRFAPVDYVFANHFLHHLDDAAIRDMLAQVQAEAARGYVLADIRRGWVAYLGVTLLTGLFFRGSFAYADGRLSVRRAFTTGELRALAGVGAADGSRVARPPGGAAQVIKLFPARLAVVGGAAA